MHVYNAIIVLKEILPVFPLVVVLPCGTDIDRAIDQLLEKEQRGDLKILGKAYAYNSLDLQATQSLRLAIQPVSRNESIIGQRPKQLPRYLHFYLDPVSYEIRRNR